MEKDLLTSLVTIATAIIGLALVASLLSKKADTANVIQSAGSALAGLVKVAVSPIVGGTGISVST